MTDQFNVLDRRNIQYIDSSSDPVSIDSTSGETELGRITIPAKFVRNGIIISATAFWTYVNPTSTVYTPRCYINSILSDNKILELPAGGSRTTGYIGMEKDIFIQNSNVITSPFGEVTTNYSRPDTKIINITLNADLPVIFTGEVTPGTVDDILTLTGYHGNVIY